MTITETPESLPDGPSRGERARATLEVAWRHAIGAARRGGPRVARSADRSARNVAGAFIALAVAAWLHGRLVLVATVASPRWAVLAGWSGELIRRRRVTLAGLLLLGIAWLIAGWWIAWIVAVPGLVWVAARVVMAVYPLTSRGRVRTRYGHDGLLTVWDHHRFLSASAVRQASPTLRPVSIAATLPDIDETAGLGAVAGQRARRRAVIDRLPVTSTGTWVGTTAVGPVIGLNCWVSHRDTCGILGAPGCGKTGLLAGQVIDHDGPVIATSTKPDLLALTGALRARRARSGRVEVFDPEGLTDGGSTFRWDPVRDCRRASVATARAAALVAASNSAGGDDGKFWADAASRVLRALLVAAALEGLDMRSVYAWATSAEKADEALALLEDTHRHAAPAGWAAELRQMLHSGARRTVESIWLTLSGSVAWMADGTVAATVCPGPDEPVFDVAAFLADESTLYLIGSERAHSTTAPLLALLTETIFEESKVIAAWMPGGRLDPPLGLFLDEAALVVPVPLSRWIADAAGRGVVIVWAAQSLSQLVERWGTTGAETIWNSTNAKIVYGGLSLTSDVETVSALCGEKHTLLPDPDGDGPGHARFERVPTVNAERVRTVPPGFAILLHRATPATIVRIVPAWERHDVRKAGPAPVVPPIRDVVADQQSSESHQRPLVTVPS